MVKRNPHVAKLAGSYLFPEIVRRKEAFLKRTPHARLISLGIGDTTEPLPPAIANSISQTAKDLSTHEGYSGYGPEEGVLPLRNLISSQLYGGEFAPDEVFISDGTNSDIGRLQTLFGSNTTVAVQDPTYPVYVDTSVILGQTASFNALSKQYHGIHYMPCSPDNDFFPVLSSLPPCDLIYFCSPNNPTGHAATKAQLTDLVNYARKHRSIIIYDSAYSAYITEEGVPRSIYEIDGAREVAIELGSFSKMAGFTGVRLGWTVVPKELAFEEGHSINRDWNRVHTTFFNGASNLAQAGGMAVLQPEGLQAIDQQVKFYLANAALLKEILLKEGVELFGGTNAPYLWVRFPGISSWDAFESLLEQAHLITAPGSGFGPAGEGFIRMSAFGSRLNIEQAGQRLSAFFSSR
jgi:LL-diaminopimelate aminotransferase